MRDFASRERFTDRERDQRASDCASVSLWFYTKIYYTGKRRNKIFLQIYPNTGLGKYTNLIIILLFCGCLLKFSTKVKKTSGNFGEGGKSQTSSLFGGSVAEFGNINFIIKIRAPLSVKNRSPMFFCSLGPRLEIRRIIKN